MTSKNTTPKYNKEPVICNQLQNHYNAASTHYAVCGDVTKLSAQNGQVYIVLDLASRCVIGHAFTSQPMEAQTVVDTNLKIQSERLFLPPIKIFHTDRESLFKNKYYETTMQHKNIVVSRGSSEAFQNQPIESFNRTFKNILKLVIMTDLGYTDIALIKKTKFLQDNYIKPEHMSHYVQTAIEKYNNKKHTKLNYLTPNQMEEALFHSHQNKHPQDLIMLTQQGSIEDAAMDLYRAQVVQKYKGDWLRFFLEWRDEQNQQHKAVVTKLDSQHKVVVTQLEEKAIQAELYAKASKAEYESLYQKHLETQKQLQYIEQQAKLAEQERDDKNKKKNIRKNAIKQGLRQTVTPEEFQKIILLAKGRTSFIKARRVVALYVLYLTGLRVSNLITLTVGQLLQLLHKGHTEISLIKGGSKRHPIRLAYLGRQIILQAKDHISYLIEHKSQEQPAFSAQDTLLPISDKTFERELNTLLKEASHLFHKHIRTHSFRATVVSSLLKSKVPLHEVQNIIGHQNISSTLAYNRNLLTAKEIDKLVNKRFKIESMPCSNLD